MILDHLTRKAKRKQKEIRKINARNAEGAKVFQIENNKFLNALNF